MANALEGRCVSLAEGEVGTGKTFAYLIACIVNNFFYPDDMRIRTSYAHSYHFTMKTNMPYVISTSSIELQKALLTEYIPKLSQILLGEGLIEKPISAVLRKGKKNYLCMQRLGKFLHTVKVSNKDDNEIAKLRASIGNTIDLDKIQDISPYNKRQICVSDCSTLCRFRKSCAYLSLLKSKQSPHYLFQICNHNYLIADITHRSKRIQPLLPNYRGIIVDEAHKFKSALRQMHNVLFDFEELKSHVQSIRSKDPAQTRLVNITSFQIDRLNTQLSGKSTDAFRFDNQDRYIAKLLIASLNDLNKVMPAIELSDAASALDALVRDEKLLCWYQKDDSNVLRASSTEAEQLIIKTLWSKTLPVILTSGTLSIDGNFDYFKSELGMLKLGENRLSTICERSPFNYADNCKVYISEATHSPKADNEKYISSLVSEIEKLVNYSEGRTLVLFTSYKVMHQVHAVIQHTISYPIVLASRGSRDAVERFKDTKQGVLFSTNAWEGIDIQGDKLTSVIIVKLPFLVPSVLSNEVKKHYAKPADYLNQIIIPNMQIKLKQGMGRLIRHEDDKGMISILDSRARHAGPYEHHVRAVLPNCPTISNLV